MDYSELKYYLTVTVVLVLKCLNVFLDFMIGLPVSWYRASYLK